MGWGFIGMSVVLGGISLFLLYYGQHLLRNPSASQPAVAISAPELPALTAPQEGALAVIDLYQQRFAASKLIIRRDGGLFFEGDTKENSRAPEVNLIEDLFGPAATAKSHGSPFEELMDGIPSEYLRRFPETRLDSPFVVTLTPAGRSRVRPR